MSEGPKTRKHTDDSDRHANGGKRREAAEPAHISKSCPSSDPPPILLYCPPDAGATGFNLNVYSLESCCDEMEKTSYEDGEPSVSSARRGDSNQSFKTRELCAE